MKCPLGHDAETEQFEKVVVMRYRTPQEDLRSQAHGANNTRLPNLSDVWHCVQGRVAIQ